MLIYANLTPWRCQLKHIVQNLNVIPSSVLVIHALFLTFTIFGLESVAEVSNYLGTKVTQILSMIADKEPLELLSQNERASRRWSLEFQVYPTTPPLDSQTTVYFTQLPTYTCPQKFFSSLFTSSVFEIELLLVKIKPLICRNVLGCWEAVQKLLSLQGRDG